ncbi:hypothetical protein [Frateuria defendens]|uniref:hypothetical protein n=1 Tax=Frateuria defendens TaxID=2219559 RepID=UPI0012933B26|nr:hypothetical protein [Frateuria defendens]
MNWLYDERTQTFSTPAGTVSLRELAQCRVALNNGHLDLTGPWAGWRLRADVMPQFLRWLDECARRDAAACGLNHRPPRRLFVVTTEAADPQARRRNEPGD